MCWSRLAIGCLVLVVASGCVRMKRSPSGRPAVRGGIVMIYGAGASRPHEITREMSEHWMTVHVTQSDSTYEFGHLDREGEFEFYCSGWEGRFRVQGGETLHFAIRDTFSEIFPLSKTGSCEFAGPPMAASKAVFPSMDETYYSIAQLAFSVQRDSTVNVELVASSPNGFAPGR